MHDVVDGDSSTDQHRTVVKRGVSRELDQLKDAYDGMEEILTKAARDIELQLPKGLNLIINVTYLPHMGFHIVVPRDGTTGEAVFDGQDLGWQMMFTTQSQVFFKDQKLSDLDHDLGDL